MLPGFAGRFPHGLYALQGFPPFGLDTTFMVSPLMGFSMSPPSEPGYVMLALQSFKEPKD